MIKKQQEQIKLFCVGCKEKVCNEQALGCNYRLHTRPNWVQKRKLRNEKIKAKKRANEKGRTRYYREYKREYLVRKILEEQT